MQFSENWLRSYVNTSLDSDALNHVMIMAGLDAVSYTHLTLPTICSV